jgi:hypothetical protein
MNYFCALASCLLLSVCSVAQTTVCLIKEDTVFAGGTDRSRINSAGEFNFIYNGPLEIPIVKTISKIASDSRDFKIISTTFALAAKEFYTNFFSDVLHKDSAYFDRQIMGNQLAGRSGKLASLEWRRVSQC